jgi:hypothetical protein
VQVYHFEIECQDKKRGNPNKSTKHTAQNQVTPKTEATRTNSKNISHYVKRLMIIFFLNQPIHHDGLDVFKNLRPVEEQPKEVWKK